MKIEICANSYQSAFNAQKAGADRIELCTELSVGGITPSFGMIKQVVTNLNIPVFVLIRPRSGNFTYSENEFEIMKQNIQLCKELGCQGIVSGVLNKDNSIDIERTKILVELSKPLQFTFHRAFDCVSNPDEALEQLINLNVDRVLSSGLQSTAEKGLELLRRMKEQSKNRIIILPGSGINPNNVKLFKEFEEIHTSASVPILKSNNKTYFGDSPHSVSSVETIQSILKQI